MNDAQCIRFLQWALPRLRLHWPGYRKVRRQVCKRIARRAAALGLASLDAYRGWLESDPEEWRLLDQLCTVTISRFFRDRGVFEALGEEVLPELAQLAAARGEAALRAWSAGCASGEEPYGLRLAWEFELRPRSPALGIEILATDMNPAVLARARAGCYPASSLKALPQAWRSAAFVEKSGVQCLRAEFAAGIVFQAHDIRGPLPRGPFHLVLCRNLVLTYFEPALQREVLERIAATLVPRGLLVVGAHEAPPAGIAAFEPWRPRLGVYRRI
jgi:chemotaxis protein methyltransferase CheR